MSRDITTVLTGFSYTEGPRWHQGRLWFSDMYTHQVLSAAEDGRELRVEAEVAGQPSGLGWLPDGRLLIVSMRDRKLLRREADGTLATHADLWDKAGGHLNDMVVDRHGRAFVGDFGFDLMGGEPLKPTGLLRVDPDGTVTEAAGELWFPNGSVITDDQVLLVNETFGNRITAFDIGDDGTLAHRREWARFGDLPTETEIPKVLGQLAVAGDGAALDAEGALWVADAVGGRVVRLREGGEILDEITPGTAVFACALGGEDGRTLFVCAAPDFHEEARKNAREATILAVRVEVPARGTA
ncbi:sugar lactone lactonase YvrE [Thermocatellispora tengchongensis]|uniref:Sugar lactone lactonase YvrE n=1 Tax=Thermocatellispora tengchongensis TaxID=1073253 RepID=A0A840PAM6_9ACTN|nr:SMP-30/gluconolactonase/LRE family protein [Thermocatellispora tengchongensis]MBB5136059.1 sugar lactone lactonase YvrE [Thermocatellispora tengchongensis]